MLQILKHFFLIIFFFVGLVSSVSGQQNTETELVRQVIDKGQKEFRSKVSDAFSEAAILLSGQRSVIQHEKFSSLAAKAEQFLVEFRYEPIDQRPIVSEFSEQKQAKWNLVMRFDEKAMTSALFELGAPVWQAPRPALKVWLVYESNTGLRQLITQDTVGFEEQKIKNYLQEQARNRGVELYFPSQVQQGVSLSALWGLFEDDIRFASEMAGDTNTLVIKLYATAPSEPSEKAALAEQGAFLPQPSVAHDDLAAALNGTSLSSDDRIIPDRVWKFHSLALLGRNSVSFEGEDPSRRLSIHAAIDVAVDQMSQVYGLQVDVAESSSSLITVKGIPDFDSYKRLRDEIKRLLVVNSALPKLAKQNDLSLKIFSRGSSDLLLTQLVKIDHLSQQIVGSEPLGDATVKEPSQIAPKLDESTNQADVASQEVIEEVDLNTAEVLPEVPHYVFSYVVDISQTESTVIQANTSEATSLTSPNVNSAVPLDTVKPQKRDPNTVTRPVSSQAYPAPRSVFGRPVEKSASDN